MNGITYKLTQKVSIWKVKNLEKLIYYLRGRNNGKKVLFFFMVVAKCIQMEKNLNIFLEDLFIMSTNV